MHGISAAATSDDRTGQFAPRLPKCVAIRAQELRDLAVLKLLELCLVATVVLQLLALSVALLSSPILHYIPEAAR